MTNYEAMANETPKEEMIDLEGLVRDIDLTPTSQIAAAAARGEGAAASNEPIHAEALSPDEIDNLLIEEDPEMAAQIEAIRAGGLEEAEPAANPSSTSPTEGASAEGDLTEASLDPAAIGNLAATRGQRISFFFLKIGSRIRAIRSLAVRSVTDSKGLITELRVRLVIGLKSGIRNLSAGLSSKTSWLRSRSWQQKLSLVLVVVALAGLFLIATQTLQGTLLPKGEKVWVASFSDIADGVFTYDPNGPFEDFNDPLLHPEFVVLVERIVVNLRRTAEAAEGAFPMAAFELYLQTDNQDSAVEIKDRNVEIRDAVARSVERVTYPELAGEEGKNKLKLLIRKDLNVLLTRGKVRRVFFKTLVLNPE